MDLEKVISAVLRKPVFGETYSVMTTTEILMKVQEHSREYFNVNELGRLLKRLDFKRINYKERGIGKKGYRVFLFENVKKTEQISLLSTKDAVRATFRDPNHGEPAKWMQLSDIAGILTKKYKKQFDRTEIKRELKAIKVRVYNKSEGGKQIMLFSVVHMPSVETK